MKKVHRPYGTTAVLSGLSLGMLLAGSKTFLVWFGLIQHPAVIVLYAATGWVLALFAGQTFLQCFEPEYEARKWREWRLIAKLCYVPGVFLTSVLVAGWFVSSHFTGIVAFLFSLVAIMGWVVVRPLVSRLLPPTGDNILHWGNGIRATGAIFSVVGSWIWIYLDGGKGLGPGSALIFSGLALYVSGWLAERVIFECNEPLDNQPIFAKWLEGRCWFSYFSGGLMLTTLFLSVFAAWRALASGDLLELLTGVALWGIVTVLCLATFWMSLPPDAMVVDLDD